MECNPNQHQLTIAPGQFSLLAELKEIWAKRELLYFLSARDIKVRYKQAAIGFAWAIVQPLLTMVVFTLVFSRIAGITTGGIPYPVFSFTGLLPWLLFQSSLSRCSSSVVSEANIISKVYFPRLLIPLSSVLSALADFFVSLFILLGFMLYYGIAPTWKIAFLPLLVFYSIFAALAVGLWFAAINARFRDVRHVVPLIVRLWMFMSPVAYPLASVLQKIPAEFHWLYSLNPMVGVIEGFRWALLDDAALTPGLFVNSIAFTTLLFIGGVLYFRRVERTFADIL
jgi:lipopolysaccharide transport system permease protein